MIRRIGLSIIAIFALANFSDAKAWRGITPLRSTLADVIRKFGPCTTTEKTRCTYVWKNETVTFVFLSDPCGTDKQTLPRRAIVRIELRPGKPTILSDYHSIDFAHFTTFRLMNTSQEYYEHYVNNDEGFAAESRHDFADAAKPKAVTQVYYTATAQEISRCPGSYVRPSDLLPRYENKIESEFFCPDIYVDCPDQTVEANQPISFSASWSGVLPYTTPTYKWTVSAGRIIAGQGTFRIRVKTKGLPDDTQVTASFTLEGAPVECPRVASCTTKIHPYRVRLRDQEKPARRKRIYVKQPA